MRLRSKPNEIICGGAYSCSQFFDSAGVTNTVEVVQAQQSLADANNNLISAQYQLNVARVELARALGLAEQGLQTYFGGRKP